MPIRVFGVEPASVFALRGRDENSATAALGWTLNASPTLLATLIADVVKGAVIDGESVSIDLQRYGDDAGFTDLEILGPGSFHIIVEAKRGWVLPGLAQLEKYAGRIGNHSSTPSTIVTISAASREYARSRLPGSVGNVPVQHRSWSDIHDLARACLKIGRQVEERVWLRHLTTHLQEYVSMQNPRDNMVYVVSLSLEAVRPGSSYSYVDVVEKDERYFHPVGNGWPSFPPNYVGFRYGGRLQSVHHVDSYTVVPSLTGADPRWKDARGDHFVYDLGPPLRPAKLVRLGRLHPNVRVYCALDLLVSGECATVADALKATKARLLAVQSQDDTRPSPSDIRQM